MKLEGVFKNQSGTIIITLRSDNSYSLTGLEGFNTDSGKFWLEATSRIHGYPTYLVLQHSTKVEHLLSTGTYKLAIKLLNNDSFAAMDNYFCEYNFDGNVVEGLYSKS